MIGGEEWSTPTTGRGDDEAIGGVGMEVAGQAHAVDRYCRLYGHQIDAGCPEYGVYPDTKLQCEMQAPLLDEEGDFPRGNGRDSDSVHTPRLLNRCACRLSETPVVFCSPDQHVCVEQQGHRKADQSDGEVAGSKGSSYFNTVPRSIPMKGGGFSSGAGTGDRTATGRPRFVIVTVSAVSIHLLDDAQTLWP